MPRVRWLVLVIAAACVSAQAAVPAAAPHQGAVQFVFTSDAHYGLSRPAFRGRTHVPARIVNRALVAAINRLPERTFPEDAGLRAGEPIGALDFVVEGGDTTNRAESNDDESIQSAATSWSQFVEDYFVGLTLRTADGRPTPLFVVPGNHEGSSAVGFHKPMTPVTDRTPLVDIFNRMMAPETAMVSEAFDYRRDRVLHAADIGGLHLEFQHIWPDSVGRAWMDRDLATVPVQTPVLIFSHDQPDVEAKHFINPNPPHTINARDRFENLLADTLQDGRTVAAGTVLEQAALEAFVRKHRNVAAYFHGNSNWNEFYDWRGPDGRIRLHAFRVDSPMKGRFSANDESRLSFHVATVDLATMTMTVRECLWNQGPDPLWGAVRTVALTR